VSLPQAVNWSKTTAYTSIRSTGQGVNVNLAGRESDGMIDAASFERVRDDVANRLLSFVDPRTGVAPVARATRREEAFKGTYADEAPDLILEPAPLYMLTHAKRAVEPADWSSGDHRIEGVFAAAGSGVGTAAFPSAPRLVDLAPTILAAVGAPASVQHTGRVLAEVVGVAAQEAAAASAQSPRDGNVGPSGLDEQEEEEVEEHLRGLGYLE